MVIRVRDARAIKYSVQYIKDTLTNYYQGAISLSFAEINSLKSELRWSRIWLKTGLITCTSGSKASSIYAEHLSSRLYFKIKHRIDDFKRLVKVRSSHHVYGYMFTINPAKLTPNNMNEVNAKIIHKFRQVHQIALIEKAFEFTAEHLGINFHFHYVIVATGRINQRKIYRDIKKIARDVTGGSVNSQSSNQVKNSKPYRRIDDWHKAISYVTKQCGRYPLPLVHNQGKKLMSLPDHQRLNILARMYNLIKGVELHRLYINRNNPLAKRWKIELKHTGQTGSSDVQHVHHIHTKNGRTTMISKSMNKITRQSNKRSSASLSRHKGSSIESMSRIYGFGYYGLAERARRYAKAHQQQLSLC